jgi:uncharacterized membrane protein YfcA
LIFNFIMLFVAAFIGGAMNAVAGGGSFFSFPALLFVGLDPKIANATNTVALWPGSAASVGAYRRELHHQRDAARALAGVSLGGGLLGALLLLVTPSDVFRQLLPYLMLGATLLFALSPRINRYVRRRDVQRSAAHAVADTPTADAAAKRRSIVLQAIISVYGGFFGGGIGILMLATLALMGIEDMHEMNALKTLLATLINGIAVLAFVVARAVAWPEALVMAVGAIIGGYGGAALARRIAPQHVRTFVMVVGFVLSAYLFVR